MKGNERKWEREKARKKTIRDNNKLATKTQRHQGEKLNKDMRIVFATRTVRKEAKLPAASCGVFGEEK